MPEGNTSRAFACFSPRLTEYLGNKCGTNEDSGSGQPLPCNSPVPAALLIGNHRHLNAFVCPAILAPDDAR
jgi:hypothetical protein